MNYKTLVMKILIINQHSMNHGDEAAGKALIRTLYDRGFQDIAVSYNTVSYTHLTLPTKA